MDNQNNNNQKESRVDFSQFFEKKEKQGPIEPLKPTEKGIKRFWQEMDEKTKLYICLATIIVSLTLTVFLLKSL